MRRDVDDLLNRLAAAEDRLGAGEFVAPAPPGGVVHVRLAGVLLRLRVGRFAGWGVFRRAGADRARLVRRATPEERQRFLDALPARRLILCDPEGEHWLAWPASRTDARFPAVELVPVHLVEDAGRFDVIDARFDGVRYWYDRTAAADALGDHLREAFARATPTDRVAFAGLTPEQLDAYARADDRRRAVLPLHDA